VAIPVTDNDLYALPGTLALGVAPGNGTISLTADGAFLYSPLPDYAGTDAFTYSAAGPDGVVRSASVEITVLPVNDAPVVRGAVMEIPEDGSFYVDLTSLVTDVDGDVLELAWVTDGAHGTTEDRGNGRVHYRPDADYFGDDSFTFEWCDPSGACAVGTIAITVVLVNDVLLAAPAGPDAELAIWLAPDTTAVATPTLVAGVVARVLDSAAIPAAALAVAMAGSLMLGVDSSVVSVIERVTGRQVPLGRSAPGRHRA
jgi:hypothetical protein